MKRLRIAVVALLVLTALAPLGCSAKDATVSTQDVPTAGTAGTPQSAGVSEEGMIARDSAESQALPPESAGVGSTDRLIVRNGSIEIRVHDTQAALVKVRAAVRASGAEIADLSVTGGDVDVYVSEGDSSASPTYASVTIRVPAEKLETLTTALARLGTVVSQSESASDVTEQAIDMEARLKNLRAEESRLRELLNRTNKVSELLAVEAELSRVRGEIESMDAQLTYLKRQAARATLVVALTEPTPVTGSESPWFGMREAFSRGVQGAITLIEVLITVLIAVLPILILAAVIVTAIVAITRRHAKKRAAAYAAATAAAQVEAEAPAEAPAEE